MVGESIMEGSLSEKKTKYGIDIDYVCVWYATNLYVIRNLY
jgi:hypothetical protein